MKVERCFDRIFAARVFHVDQPAKSFYEFTCANLLVKAPTDEVKLSVAGYRWWRNKNFVKCECRTLQVKLSSDFQRDRLVQQGNRPSPHTLAPPRTIVDEHLRCRPESIV